ncbi:MAG: methylated-DNA--[protein]-cysteine S-methyltransferase [Planctomycetota bacterium]
MKFVPPKRSGRSTAKALPAREPCCCADRIASPLGPLWLVVNEAGALVQLDFEDGRHAPDDRDELGARYAARGLELRWNRARVRPVAAAVKRLLKGQAPGAELAVAPHGTPFQRRVWKALLRIPRGSTWSYGQLARRVGMPGAARAVGAANGANPISIVIPCHRVVGSDGRLTGYSAGVERKRALLELEGALDAAGRVRSSAK